MRLTRHTWAAWSLGLVNGVLLALLGVLAYVWWLELAR